MTARRDTSPTGQDAGNQITKMIDQLGEDLSIVIVSYNTRDLLDACLASVRDPGSGVRTPGRAPEAGDVCTPGLGATVPETEVIVVDNGSSDGSVEMLHAQHPAVRVIEMGNNAGFARASNEGIRASRGRYVLLLNSDTLLLDRALQEMVAFLDTHPHFAVAGPLLLNGDGTTQTSCFAFTSVRDILFESLGLTALFPHSPIFNRRGLGGFDRSGVREVDWVSGACMIVRRTAIERVGLLDEDFFMYGEELDWCYRMKQAGLRVAFFPGAQVVHYGRASSTRTRGELAPRALAGRLRYFRKHHGAAAVLAVRALTVAGMSLRLLALPLRAALHRSEVRRDFVWYSGLLRGALK